MKNWIAQVIKKLCKFLFYLPWNIYNRTIFNLHGVKCGSKFESRGRIFVRNKGYINIDSNVRINSSPTANPIGVGSRMYFQVLEGGNVFIGSGTGISNSAITCKELVSIGKNVRIGSGCKIYDTDFHNMNPFVRTRRPEVIESIRHRPVIIEDNVFIGAGCYILKGTVVGFGSVIGAGSVVTGGVPPFEVWAGNPAKFIRKLSVEECGVQQ